VRAHEKFEDEGWLLDDEVHRELGEVIATLGAETRPARVAA
jgi:hypothetical protein